MQTIKKFKIDRSYYPNGEKLQLFHILSRNGKELEFKWATFTTDGIDTIHPMLAADEKGAFEYFLYEGMRITARNILPEGRNTSELPAEEQKIINDAIMRDIEYHKNKKQ